MRWAEEVIQIADAPVTSVVQARHAALRMATRMQVAERLLPGRFGRRLTVVHAEKRSFAASRK